MPHSRDRSKMVLAMVGLPARGKTYTARKIARYLSWLGHNTRVFNVGSYRREHFGASQPHDFFDPSNAQGRAALFDMAVRALNDMTEWLANGGEVAIYDATNSTRRRRQLVTEACTTHNIPLIFVESICDDPSVIEATIRETKSHSPDYTGMDPEKAAADFRARIAHYESAYETIENPSANWIKIVDVGRQVVLNRIHGHLPARLAPLLINMHIGRRPIFLTRHGESLSNLRGAIGGDSELTLRGETYARALADFMRSRAASGEIEVARPPAPPSSRPGAAVAGAGGGGSNNGIPAERPSRRSAPPMSLPPQSDSPIAVWTSTLRRTIQTSSWLTANPMKLRALDEIDAGLCDGMTYAEIKERMPAEYDARKADKFIYRYPRGESYEDVIQRLDPVIIELERQRAPVLVIAHQAILRAIYGYFMDKPPEEIPYLEIPLHTVIQLTPTAYGCEEKRFPLLTITESDLTASSS
ncbi:MAG: 6-phosphofructo-2-kinase domain-containing protein [Polyangiaceae bacterium]